MLPFGALAALVVDEVQRADDHGRIFTTEHYEQIFTFQNIRDAIWNTIYLAVLCGAICVLVGLADQLHGSAAPEPSRRG